MSEAQLTSYDELPYESKPLYPTHPDCLGTLATLLGMTPAPVDNCRVLELGCASGGNLIPMAEALPGSRFVGIDLSPVQVKSGQAVVDALGLPNIELRALSILEIDDSFGQFDYISCHGVYSWVPPEVQAKILSICARNLAPQGVAYISYNTLPGWHQRAAVREMMNYHVQRFPDAKTRVEQARAFLEFLVASAPRKDGPYHHMLRQEADVLRKAPDTYLFHEHLEDANYPVYFFQFMERAAAHGLQYLGESWSHPRLENLPADVQNTLRQLDDLIQLEQYLDFLHNRTFRRTLLCHAGIALDRTPGPAVFDRFHLTGLVKPVSATPDLDSLAVEPFVLDDGTTASTNDALVKAGLMVLFEAWPRAVPFRSLWSAVHSRLPSLAAQGPRALEFGPPMLAQAMLRCYLSNLAAVHIYPPPFTLEISARPVASSLARLQAATGARVTNRRHRLVELVDLDRMVVGYLDGSKDRPAIVEALMELVARKELTLQGNPEASEDMHKMREILQEAVEPSLRRLARSAVLVA
jgi:SAM-dependent methyltransferase